MKKLHAKALIGVFGLIALQGAANAEVDIRLRAGAGYGNYSVESKIAKTGPTTRQINYDADYVGIPVGLTFIADNDLYFDLLYQSSSGDAKFDWTGESPKFSRDDTTLTIGARIESFSVYMAYKSGESTTSWPAGYSSDTFAASGFLAGLGWAKPIGNGALTLSGGVGIMEGTYKYTDDPDRNTLSSDITVGYSVGAGYTYSFGRHFSLSADLRWQSYDYTFESVYSITEGLSQATLNAMYTF